MAARLQFKFRGGTDRASRERLLRELRARGVKDVRRLLPGEKDPALAALYTVECAEEAGVEEILQQLRTAPEVEFAEAEVRRKPLGPR